MDRENKVTYVTAQNTRNRRSINGRREALQRRGESLCREPEPLVNPVDAGLIEEAVMVNHAQIGKEKTLKDYTRNMRHFAAFVASSRGATITTAKRRDVLSFMRHLEVEGGANPHVFRLSCSWCEAHAFPDGREGKGWSAQRRKAALSAIRFLYRHLIEEELLDAGDPSAHIGSPKIPLPHQFTPSREEVQRVFDAPGDARDRLLAYWMYYAPSRRETFRQAKWCDIEGMDTNEAYWFIPSAKGGKRDGFGIHPVLRREFRRYQAWQREEAQLNPRVARALVDDRTAYILLTSGGKQVHASTLTKMIKWRGVRAEVGIVQTNDTDAVAGRNSLLTPHALRRAWADHALNDPNNPVPLDVVSGALNHASTQTTINHYARPKRNRVHDALKQHRL